jgi:putative hydrolases of HD superfamily
LSLVPGDELRPVPAQERTGRGGQDPSSGAGGTPEAPAQELSRASAAGQLDAVARFAQQRDFIVAIDQLKNVLRATRLTDDSREENSAEHSWHLAVMALLLHEHAPGDVDPLHVIRLLLVHDIVEIDAGDTHCYDEDANAHRQERERAAAVRLFGLLPDDQSSEMLALWEEFDTMRTPAALFANALDRLQPFILGPNRDSPEPRFHERTREQFLRRMDPVRTAMPEVWEFVAAIVAGEEEARRRG